MSMLRLLAAAFGALSCSGPTDLVPYSNELLVQVLLQNDSSPVQGFQPSDTSIFALVGIAAKPGTVQYVTADSLVVIRQSDGLRFRFLPNDNVGVFRYLGVSPRGFDGNYELSRASHPGRPGREALSPGVYTLSASVGPRVITGRAVLPATPHPRVVQLGGKTFVAWSPCAGAFEYQFGSETDTGGLLTRDTIVELKFDRMDNTEVDRWAYVTAFDSNYSVFFRDSKRAVSGLNNAIGLFAGVAGGQVAVPAVGPPR